MSCFATWDSWWWTKSSASAFATRAAQADDDEGPVLSMSATPIPRTLHMSLLGIRDMSVIETPPKDRLAIHTVVAHSTLSW